MHRAGDGGRARWIWRSALLVALPASAPRWCESYRVNFEVRPTREIEFLVQRGERDEGGNGLLHQKPGSPPAIQEVFEDSQRDRARERERSTVRNLPRGSQ